MVEIYLEIIFSHQTHNKTSVNPKEYQKNKEYNDDLKEFFAPVLLSDKALKMKKI